MDEEKKYQVVDIAINPDNPEQTRRSALTKKVTHKYAREVQKSNHRYLQLFPDGWHHDIQVIDLASGGIESTMSVNA